jgi:hemerythrin-like domain-containing protein
MRAARGGLSSHRGAPGTEDRKAMMNESSAPSSELRREHRVIERVLAVLARLVARIDGGGELDKPAAKRCVEFFRLFADACHHAKEEELLFPALEARGVPREGGPIGVMLYEHAVGRRLTREMGTGLEACDQGSPDGMQRFCDAARSYLRLLTDHIAKEDNVLFRIGDTILSGDDCRRLCTGYEEVACRRFDGRRRDELEKLADDLENAMRP